MFMYLLLFIYIVCAYAYAHKESADLAVAHYSWGLRMPLEINNNETYADMTNCLPRNGKASVLVIPVGIYRYFGFSNKR